MAACPLSANSDRTQCSKKSLLNHLVGARERRRRHSERDSRNGRYGTWADARPYSALMLTARTTLPHFSVSSATTLLKSTGEPGNSVPQGSSSADLRFASSSAAFVP